MNLSPQREKFAQEVARTGNASAAYRTAFPRAKRWNSKDVHTEASRLLAHPKVFPRVSALRQRAEDRLGMSREKWLAGLVRETKGGMATDRLRALDMIGKAMGYYAPEKHEHSGEVKQTPPIRIIGMEERVAAVLAVVPAAIADHEERQRLIAERTTSASACASRSPAPSESERPL